MKSMCVKRVYISRIVPGGLADDEGTLRLNDRLISVSDRFFLTVESKALYIKL
jgi:hypothetical protein